MTIGLAVSGNGTACHAGITVLTTAAIAFAGLYAGRGRDQGHRDQDCAKLFWIFH